MKKLILLFIVSLLVTSCQKELQDSKKVTGLITEKAMVVSARVEASRIGTEILKKGGNAFDAMMATELALAVAYPYAGNIGGGGFMVYRKNDGEIGALDYREKAPLAASKDMYLDTEGNVIKGKSTSGANAVGVPGTIAGVFKAQEKFGVLSVKEVLTPVIALAKKGVLVTKKQEKRILKHQKDFKKVNKDTFIFLDPWKEGDTIKYIALANTLERILKNGRDEFYKGETAKKLAKFVQSNGGIITEDDLEKYASISAVDLLAKISSSWIQPKYTGTVVWYSVFISWD